MSWTIPEERHQRRGESGGEGSRRERTGSGSSSSSSNAAGREKEIQRGRGGENAGVAAFNATTSTLQPASEALLQPATAADQGEATGANTSCGFLVGMLALQLLFLWLGLRDFVPFTPWWQALAVYGGCLVAAVVLGTLFMYGGGGGDGGGATSFLPPQNLALVGAFIFMYNAVPSASIQFSNYQYDVFENEKCRLQYVLC